MNNYILIQGIEKHQKMYLKSSERKSGKYKMKCGKSSIELTPFLEALIANELENISGHNSSSAFIRSCIPDITVRELDDFYERFYSEHTYEDFPQYCYEEIPLIATEDKDLELPLSEFNGKVDIPLGYERWFLNELIGGAIRGTLYDKAMKVCDSYCDQYGYSVQSKAKQKKRLNALVWGLCMAHGIDFEYICRESSGPEPKINIHELGKHPFRIAWYILVLLFCIAFFIGGIYLLLRHEDWIDKWGGWFCVILGGLGPLAWASENIDWSKRKSTAIEDKDSTEEKEDPKGDEP